MSVTMRDEILTQDQIRQTKICSVNVDHQVRNNIVQMQVSMGQYCKYPDLTMTELNTLWNQGLKDTRKKP